MGTERIDTIREILTIIQKRKRDYGRLARKSKTDNSLTHREKVHEKFHHHWISYQEMAYDLQAMLDELTSASQNASTTQSALPTSDVVGRSEQVVCPDCKSKARIQNGFIFCENDDCGGIYRTN